MSPERANELRAQEEGRLVSVVILNYNSGRLISQCLQSVAAQSYKPLEVLVIDNASTDGSPELLARGFPHVPILRNEVNLGFARGHNMGIAATSGAFYLPLNPDVSLTPGYVSEVVSAMATHPRAGRATGKLCYMDGKSPPRIYSVGHGLQRWGKAYNIGAGREDVGQFESPAEVFGVPGAAPLYRREMLEDVRLGAGEYFDEDFFMYGEDVELDWRAQMMGWSALYVPRALAYHFGGGSGEGKNPRLRRERVRNRYLPLLKALELRPLLRCLPGLGGELLGRLIREPALYGSVVGELMRHLPAIRRQHRSLSRRRSGEEVLREWLGQEFRPVMTSPRIKSPAGPLE